MDRGTAYLIITGLATATITIVILVVGVVALAFLFMTIQTIWADFWALFTT